MKKQAQHKQPIEASLTGRWGRLELSPQRAVWWPDQEILLFADFHLGKETTFRQHGLAVPEGATAKSLQRASDLIAKYQPKRVFFLGDLFHSRSSLSAIVLSRFSKFLNLHPEVEFTLIKGNHDIHTGKLPESWNLGVVDPPLTIASIILAHYPQAPSGDCDLVIAGHLHPAARLPGELRQEGKWPCFVLTNDNCLVVPAFGEFVGTSLVGERDTQRLWLIMANQILNIPTQLL